MGTTTPNNTHRQVEAEGPWEGRDLPETIYQMLSGTADKFGSRNALTFQMFSGPQDKAETLSWNQLRASVTQAANMFRSLGIGDDDVVAYVLPNCNETAITLLGGATAGIVNPINPLLEPEQIGAILRETKAKVVVTLKSFPKTDVAQKVAEAVKHAPKVDTVLEVDLLRYLTPPKKWIVPFIRPKNPGGHHADLMDFATEMAKHRSDALDFVEPGDRVSAFFHTGGTTGMPKVAQHKHSGMIYNGWLGQRLLFTEEDTLICPLPLFHVFAAYPTLMSVLASGAHVVFPTPAGYRGDGVFDNFWKLIERWKVTFVITVPTAIAALMQRPVDADVSSLRIAFSGSAPLPVELYNRFEKATGVTICEGYGLTEATCLVSINPPDDEKKIGSVGIPFPHTDVRILHCDADGNVNRECGVDEVGEICVSNPGVFDGSTYTEEAKNLGLFAEGKYLRTGDLGRLDADGYLYITGRAKDLIIRGGHNIDPAEIEEALAGHPAIAFVGAIGQPDSFAGELPCAYVELVDGAEVTTDALMEHAKVHIHERAAFPKYIEVLDELPKTAVGKVFKPELRKKAITRIYNDALAKAGHAVHVGEVAEDKKRGLVARLVRDGDVDEEAVSHVLGEFTRPWEWADD
ncbi:acyl-CoA synthetase [Actibacterium lipolyticum]|uniref:Long-chain-fatty-acid--CoA ligase n=1 Tax=Actibacterium lipolyticum TaxID=1524263 RepID=A0A238JNF6_9RHOB|nr:acyl-CoA synthetase [Actibacterium lipolyticum]SMX32200.1 Long-chain-fatty-acid--CoA ligase [Actibacterium lipolyticum]